MTLFPKGWPDTLNRDGLDRMAEPGHRVLATFIHGCSPDPSTRTAATTALVLGLWQLRGCSLTREVPSLLLLNALEESGPDPVDAFVRGLVFEEAPNEPGEQTQGPFAFAPPDLAPSAMENAVRRRRTLASAPESAGPRQEEARALLERYRAAQRAGHGYGLSRPYSRAWHGDFGLLTDSDHQLVLRLNGAPDRAAFRKDVLENPLKLLLAEGLGDDLFPIRKTLSVSGEFPPEFWSTELAAGIVDLGLPILPLPHATDSPLSIANPVALDCLGALWRHGDDARVEASPRLPPFDWFEACETSLRERLGRLPGPYAFAVLQAVHQLGGVCHRIVSFACRGTGAGPEETVALLWDLQAQSLRGIVVCIAGLAWHCLGFDPGCPRPKALKVLRELREKGPLSPSELLQRRAHLSKEEGELLLERLAAEDLVRPDGRRVAATTYAEFVAGLYARPAFPEPRNHWAALVKDGKTGA